MIAQYNEHAANERTFLAWIRTAIAVIALGFFIEKFNLFMLMLANAALGEPHRSQSVRLLGRIGRYDGLVLICGGLALVLLATIRFVRTARLLDDAQIHSAQSMRAELIMSGCLILIVTSYSFYLAFGS